MTLPALGVKFKLDDRRRIFTASNQICTNTPWQTAQAVWKSRVWSQVIRNPTGQEGKLHRTLDLSVSC